MAVSDDESLIITGENILIKNYASDAIITELERPEGLTTSAELIDFGWLDNVAVGLYTNETNYYLGFYSNNLEITYTFIELEHEIVSMFAAEDNIVAVVEEQGSFNVVVIAVEQDSDQDGLPKWWEISYGLDDTDAADASADSDEDNLSNLQEFQALTDPLLLDTDGDGLNDGREVLDLMLNPLVADTDGDFLPDLWEVENGLDGSDVSDAQLDSDNDGVINFHEYLSGTDPQDSASVPEAIVNSLFSFEDSVLPDEWEVSGETTFSNAQSYQGDISLAMNGDVTIKWKRLFADVELDFHLFSDCYSIYDKSYELYVDGQLESSGYIEQVEWTKLNLLVHAGFKDVSLVIDSNDSNCNLYIDAINAMPMRSVFELGGNVVSKYEGKLHFYGYDGALVRETSIPTVLDGSYNARDIVVLDDGRVAVYNGVFQPVLSIYTPSENKWESIAAPAWSTVNNGTYGGIDAIGNKVFVTNMSTSGSSRSGIVQFDLDDSSVSYIEGEELIDLTVGYDDYVYGLTGSSVYKYETSTLEVIDTISIDSARSIAVDADGNIYAATWNSSVNKYQQDGTLSRTLAQAASFYDIALRANGSILLSDRSKYVYQTDTNLTDIERRSTMNAEFLDFVPDVDSDSDGLPNWWEYAFGLNMDDNLDALIDHDGDGLPALTEYKIGTRENNEDTDSDGLPDGYEYNIYDTDPNVSDSDSDGLLDGQEEELGTDPNRSDSDEDGLSDYEEVMAYSSDPLVSDTDADGMEDAYEVIFGLDANVDDANSDLDGDGLTNIEEHDAGSDPNLLDTDGDTLSDYDEVTIHLTSPILIDTDSDKLPDQWELQYSLDPLSAENASMDDDADQFSALEEYYGDSDPTESSDFPLPIVWKTNQGNERHTGYTPHILNISNFSFKWEVDSLWRSLLPVTATDSMVFVSSDSYFSSQGIAGLDVNTGDIVWQLDYEGIHSINAPAYDDGSVFFQTGGHGDSYIRSVDALTGELEFESSYGNQWSRYLAPTIYAGNVYMAGGSYGGTYGFVGNTGEQLWFYSGPQYDEFTPAVDEENVYSFTTQLDILDRSTGTLTNSIAFPNFSWGGYSVGVSTVLTQSNNVVVTQRGTLVVFDVENLDIKWQKTSSGFSSQVSVANSDIYAIANGSLYVIDEESGEIKWIEGSRNYNTNIIVTKTHLIVGDASTTYAINLDTQEEDWSYAASGYLTLSENGTLYISGSSLIAIALK
jgi:outer membrane protein assembly factor BamB